MWKIPECGLLGVLLLGLFVGCGSQGQPVSVASMPAEISVTDTLPPAIQVSKNYLLGKFDPASHPDFVVVGKPYTDKPGMMLRKEAFEAFQKMWDSARKDGITLRIISSTRTFEQQKNIWEGKWNRFAKDAPEPLDRARKILEYSSMPGSSRHHWGTDIDLNDLNNPSFEAGGAHEKVYQWLSAHAQEYGFCQPYTPGRPNGYQEEKWHWSYTPLSKPFLQQYRNTITNADIQGFQGAQLASEVKAVEHYVLGIGELCMPE
jgi:LAS superfamily LD-carboxypeptidase LdcB